MTYQLNNDSWKVVKNIQPKGGSDISSAGYPSFVNSHKVKIKSILHDWENLKQCKDKYIFKINYSEIPPKSKRPIFNLEKILNIYDVKQRALLQKEDGKIEIYYELTIDEYKNFLDVLKKSLINQRNCTMEYINKTLVRIISDSERFISIRNIEPDSNISSSKLVQLLYIESDIKSLLNKGVLNGENYFPETSTALLNPSQYKYIYNNFPWLLISILSENKIEFINKENNEIDINPEFNFSFNKTVIGVIDSGIKLEGPLAEGLISKEDHREIGNARDYKHGTMVSSLIIANDELNPTSKDGLGNFKIKHFELLEPRSNDVTVFYTHFISKINEIISNNKKIKVWNLSFGGLKIPYSTMTSKSGIVLDKIASENDVAIIVASGNDRQTVQNEMESLNQPGDSLNSITCGSVSIEKGNKVSYSDYSSLGRIMHYEKPEISHWGGPKNQDNSNLVSFDGDSYVQPISGTSFAAPRLSRLIAHFIENGYNPTEAKAKAIAIAKRETPSKRSSAFGYIEHNNSYERDIEIKTTRCFKDNKPEIVDINLVGEVREVIISMSRNVDPIQLFGEEISIHNIELSLIWYDRNCEEPLRDGKSKTIDATQIGTKYNKESERRYEDGKYFNSKKKTFVIKKINNAKNILLNNLSGINPSDLQLAIKIKKLDLFETEESQEIKASIYVCVNGEIDKNEFEEHNSNLIETEIFAEI